MLKIIMQTVTQAPIFLAIVTLIGLLLQRKKVYEMVDGVIKTLVGMVMLSTGANLLTGTLTPIITKLNEVTGVKGVVPQNFAVYGEMLSKYTSTVIFIFLGAFLVNLLLVKIIPFKICKNVYLTVHVSLICASFLSAAIPPIFNTNINSISTIIIGSILLGLYNTLSPVIPRLLSRSWNNDSFTLGHQLQVGTLIAATVAKIVGNPEQDAEQIKLPKGLSILKDVTIAMAIIMPCIFIGMGIAIGQKHISEMSNTTYWLVWLFLQGITFTAAFTILLMGVRMFINQLLPAFKGISERFAKGCVPALDCAVYYTYSSTGAMLGFISATLAAIVVMILTIVLKLPIVVFPSPNIVVFDGMLMGVFGNRYGGWKGAIAAGFVVSFIVHFLVILLYPLTGPLYGFGLTYSQTDYSVFWMPFMSLIKFFKSLLGF